MSIQNEPIDRGDATDRDKIDGIIEQTRGDLAQGNVNEPRDVLTQRLTEAGLVVGPAEFEELLARLA
jgi:hypothetical protein